MLSYYTYILYQRDARLSLFIIHYYDRTMNKINYLYSNDINNRSNESRRNLYSKSDKFRRYRYYERYDERI